AVSSPSRASAAAAGPPAARSSRTAARGQAAGGGSTATAGAQALVREGICTAPAADKAAAARLSAGILGALRGRAGTHGVTVYDVETGISCYTGASQHMDSASIVKTIILA